MSRIDDQDPTQKIKYYDGEWIKSSKSDKYYYHATNASIAKVAALIAKPFAKEALRVTRVFTLPFKEGSTFSSWGYNIAALVITPLAHFVLLGLKAGEHCGSQKALEAAVNLETWIDGDLPQQVLLSEKAYSKESIHGVEQKLPLRNVDRSGISLPKSNVTINSDISVKRPAAELSPEATSLLQAEESSCFNAVIKKTLEKTGILEGLKKTLGISKGKEKIDGKAISKAIKQGLKWDKSAKDEMPRYMLALLNSGEADKVAKANFWLLTGTYSESITSENLSGEIKKTSTRSKPWGKCGTWDAYDFAETTFTTIYHKFQKDLRPEVQDHLRNVLITQKGAKPHLNTDRFFGFLAETENHVLMGESNRYLANMAIKAARNTEIEFDNSQNGLEEKMLHLLKGFQTAGFFEYNARPYVRLSIGALLNLASYGSPAVKEEAKKVLDYLCFTAAVSSHNFHRYPSFRRRPDREVEKTFNECYLTTALQTWAHEVAPSVPANYKKNGPFSALTLLHDYRPPAWIVDIATGRAGDYFVELGHGDDAPPESYCRYLDCLISSGGARPTDLGQHVQGIVARPICIFTDNDVNKLEETIHIKSDKDYTHWNHTGVHDRFAVAEGKVHIPTGLKPLATMVFAQGAGTGKIYEKGNVFIFTYDSPPAIGLVALFDKSKFGSATLLLEQIKNANEGRNLLHAFSFPDGNTIEYDVKSPKDRSVITKITDKNGKPLLSTQKKFKEFALISADPQFQEFVLPALQNPAENLPKCSFKLQERLSLQDLKTKLQYCSPHVQEDLALQDLPNRLKHCSDEIQRELSLKDLPTRIPQCSTKVQKKLGLLSPDDYLKYCSDNIQSELALKDLPNRLRYCKTEIQWKLVQQDATRVGFCDEAIQEQFFKENLDLLEHCSSELQINLATEEPELVIYCSDETQTKLALENPQEYLKHCNKEIQVYLATKIIQNYLKYCSEQVQTKLALAAKARRLQYCNSSIQKQLALKDPENSLRHCASSIQKELALQDLKTRLQYCSKEVQTELALNNPKDYLEYCDEALQESLILDDTIPNRPKDLVEHISDSVFQKITTFTSTITNISSAKKILQRNGLLLPYFSRELQENRELRAAAEFDSINIGIDTRYKRPKRVKDCPLEEQEAFVFRNLEALPYASEKVQIKVIETYAKKDSGQAVDFAEHLENKKDLVKKVLKQNPSLLGHFSTKITSDPEMQGIRWE